MSRVVGSRARRPLSMSAHLLVAMVLLTCVGCLTPSSTSGRWFAPLGLAGKQELSEQPEFRQQVQKDPFPSASQVGVLSPRQKKTK